MPIPPAYSIRAFVCLTSAFALPALAHGASAVANDVDVTSPTQADHLHEAATVSDDATAQAETPLPNVTCLAKTVCAIKDKIRWGTPAWSDAECQTIARAILNSSEKHHISPTLLLAVMINESDLNEKSARPTMHEKQLYAKDSGLMAIRCVLDKHEHCTNGNVRGLKWKDLMTPATNIELGARELAYWRDGGGTTSVVVKLRDASGHLRPVLKKVPCRHKDHAYWAHYNHGPQYITQGYPRHYPHRVAVLDHALATVLNIDPPELHAKAITIHDVGKRQRTVDRPLEARYKKLCTQIQSVRSCSAVAMN
ncbi:MAG TPA: transglycosylase SLT domain-containing protein [Polyangia bacterium]|nr:transglycosylase SLT domain-containing protein [Polyangia bacterium]